MTDLALKIKSIQEMVAQLDDDQIDELLAELRKRIEEGVYGKSTATGTAAGLARAVMADHLANRRGTANSFIRACRRLGSSFSQGAALKIAMQAFPREYKAYVDAQNRGESLPPLFRKPGYQKRLQRAIKNGGRLV